MRVETAEKKNIERLKVVQKTTSTTIPNKAQIQQDTVSFRGGSTFSLAKHLRSKILHFFEIRKTIKQTKQKILEVAQKYQKEKGIYSENSFSFKRLHSGLGGQFVPLDTGIEINDYGIKTLSAQKHYLEKEKYTTSLIHWSFNLPVHESQHKYQATQVYRLAGIQDWFLDKMKSHVQEQREINAELKKRTIYDDRLRELFKDFKFSNLKDIYLVLIARRNLRAQLKSEELALNNFDINKVKEYYDSVLKQKGHIIKGTKEEKIALEYKKGFDEYVAGTAIYKSKKCFNSREERTAFLEEMSKKYKDNALEIDARRVAKEYVEKNKDEIQTYINGLK